MHCTQQQAVDIGRPACVRVLLEAGGSIEARDRYGYTPLSWATHNRSSACVQLLLQGKADVEAANDVSMLCCVLHWFALDGTTDTVLIPGLNSCHANIVLCLVIADMTTPRG